MELPKQLKVGSHIYKVQQGPEHSKYLGARDCYGETSHPERLIQITQDYGPEQQRDTMLHETLHCVVFQAGLNKEWGDDEEKYVDRLAKGLLMVFHDNPELARMLLPEA